MKGERPPLWRHPRMIIGLAAAFCVAAGVVAWQALAAPGFGGRESSMSLVDRGITWYLEKRPDLLEPPLAEVDSTEFVIESRRGGVRGGQSP
jgi:hypothetical protein